MKRIQDLDIDGKRVILRVDYNVPTENGFVMETKKIDDTFETLDYLVEHKAKVLILSHFGRVKNTDDKKNNSLKIVYDYIKGLNKYNILFSEEPMGARLDVIAKSLMPGQLALIENTRFLDLEGNLESGNDVQLAMYWASLADYYINDAFGTMHRAHASIVGIPRFLESAAGFLVQKEVDNLDVLIHNTPKPFVVVMGGAKLEDKIELIYTLVEKCDFLLLGGGIANTFLKAAGYDVGASLYSESSVETAKAIMQEFPDKIILPKDVIVSPSFSDSTYELKSLIEITPDDVIGDIGSGAVQNYRRILEKASTVFVNGTVGMYEQKPFSNGTSEILNIISSLDAIKIVGGGDASAATLKYRLSDKMTFVSTGGGATLSYIADGSLVGLEPLIKAKEN